MTITIDAKNAASPAFQQIARDAEAMGAKVTQAGTTSARSLKEMEDRARNLGAAAGVLVGGMSLAGQSFVSQEQQLRGLQRAYGESADDIERFADELQRSTVYSDDSARQAAQIASTLQRSYGLTTDQITQLIARTADLASVNVTSTGAQFELADAVARTSGAIRGEGEAAEALGLTLSDSAVAAAAAARGLTGWNTTMTEAEKAAFRFQLLMEQSTYAMGAAGDAADTNAGKTKQLVNQFQDLTQSVGGALGPLGEYTAVLGNLALAAPLAGAALGKLAAGFGAVGLTAPVIAALAGLAASGAYAYSLNQPGSGTGQQTAGFIGGAAGFVKQITPGSYGDALFEDIQAQYLSIINGEDFEAAARAALMGPLESNQGDSVVANRIALLLGLPPGQSLDQLMAEVDRRAQAGGYQSSGQYILGAASTNPNFVQTPSGAYVPRDVWNEQQRQAARERVAALQATQTSYVGSPGTGGLQNATGIAFGGPDQGRYYGDTSATYTGPFQSAEMTRPALTDQPRPSGLPAPGQSAEITFLPQIQGLQDYRDALREGRVELELLNGAQLNAADAQTTLHVTQQNLTQEQGVYNQQQSEYQTQLNAVTAAEDLLNQRKADGVELTKEQEDFLSRADAAQERLQGGTEDAILAQGELGVQFAENMKLGDELNQSMEGNASSTDALTETINALIVALGGVPPETDAHITNNAVELTPEVVALSTSLSEVPPETYAAILGNVGEAGAMAGGVFNLAGALDALNGKTATATIINRTINTIENQGGGFIPITGRHGGVMGYAGGGVVIEAGEAGPEMMWMRNGQIGMALGRGLYDVPRGTYVSPAPASKRALASLGGDGIHLHNPTINIYPATGDVQREFTAALVGDWRA